MSACFRPDAVTSVISLPIVHHAWKSGASKLTLAPMLGNVGIHFLVGSVPVVGDFFDVAWKANRKNAHAGAHLNSRSGKREVR